MLKSKPSVTTSMNLKPKLSFGQRAVDQTNDVKKSDRLSPVSIRKAGIEELQSIRDEEMMAAVYQQSNSRPSYHNSTSKSGLTDLRASQQGASRRFSQGMMRVVSQDIITSETQINNSEKPIRDMPRGQSQLLFAQGLDSRNGSSTQHKSNEGDDSIDRQITRVSLNDYESVKIGGIRRDKRYKISQPDSPISLKAKFDSQRMPKHQSSMQLMDA